MGYFYISFMRDWIDDVHIFQPSASNVNVVVSYLFSHLTTMILTLLPLYSGIYFLFLKKRGWLAAITFNGCLGLILMGIILRLLFAKSDTENSGYEWIIFPAMYTCAMLILLLSKQFLDFFRPTKRNWYTIIAIGLILGIEPFILEMITK